MIQQINSAHPVCISYSLSTKHVITSGYSHSKFVSVASRGSTDWPHFTALSLCPYPTLINPLNKLSMSLLSHKNIQDESLPYAPLLSRLSTSLPLPLFFSSLPFPSRSFHPLQCRRHKTPCALMEARQMLFYRNTPSPSSYCFSYNSMSIGVVCFFLGFAETFHLTPHCPCDS